MAREWLSQDSSPGLSSTAHPHRYCPSHLVASSSPWWTHGNRGFWNQVLWLGSLSLWWQNQDLSQSAPGAMTVPLLLHCLSERAGNLLKARKQLRAMQHCKPTHKSCCFPPFFPSSPDIRQMMFTYRAHPPAWTQDHIMLTFSAQTSFHTFLSCSRKYTECNSG